ncbi:MAG: lipopolysaccharide biosynthesis protein [Candidatus Omnitrophota bacterium]
MESISKKVKHGIKWQFIANIICQVTYFINGIVLARILSPKDFGLYGMTQVLSGFIFMFWQLGINSAIIQREEISDEHLNTAFTISLAMGAGCFSVMWISAPLLARFFGEPSLTLLARLIGITFIIYALDRVPSALLGRNMFFKNISLVGIANSSFYGIVAIPLAMMGYGPFSFVWGIIAGALGMTLIRIYWGFKFFNWKPKLLFDGTAARHLLGFGVFIALSETVGFFSWNLQRIIAGKYLGTIDLGYFTRASNLGQLPAEKVKSNIVTVLLPGFSSIQNDNLKVREWFRKFNFFTYSIAVPVLFFFTFFPKETIIGLFGEKWLASAEILPWLSLAVLLSLSQIYFINILQAVGKPFMTFIIGFLLLIPFAAGLYFAVNWGLKGIAVVLFVYNVISLVTYLSVLHKERIIRLGDFVRSSIEPILVSLLASLITLFVARILGAYIRIAEIRLIVLVTVYTVMISPYFIYRIFVKSYISYLGFDIRKVIKI